MANNWYDPGTGTLYEGFAGDTSTPIDDLTVGNGKLSMVYPGIVNITGTNRSFFMGAAAPSTFNDVLYGRVNINTGIGLDQINVARKGSSQPWTVEPQEPGQWTSQVGVSGTFTLQTVNDQIVQTDLQYVPTTQIGAQWIAHTRPDGTVEYSESWDQWRSNGDLQAAKDASWRIATPQEAIQRGLSERLFQDYFGDLIDIAKRGFYGTQSFETGDISGAVDAVISANLENLAANVTYIIQL